MQTALKGSTLVRHQVEQNAQEEVQQHSEVGQHLLYVLYLKDRAIISLNKANASGITYAVDIQSWHFIC